MKLLIDISEEDYKTLVNVNDSRLPSMIAREHLFNAIANSTPLPKGHGKLQDVNKIYDKIDALNRSEKYKGKYTGVLAILTTADTIIEADKE